jgi:hypothetical protein
MQAEDEFRSRLRTDLEERPQPPLGGLAADALRTGQRLRRRQRTLRGVTGAAAVAVVAVGSVTLADAFGSDTGAAVGPGGVTTAAAPRTPASPNGPGTPGTPKLASPPTSGLPTPEQPTPPAGTQPARIPPGWTVPAATKVTDPEWVTPRAIVAELQKILPTDTQTSGYSGDYAYGGGDPRSMWAVIGELTATTPKGQVHLSLTLHKYDGIPTGGSGCASTMCATKQMADGSWVTVQHAWGLDQKGAFVSVARPDGMSTQATVRDASKISDDELFAVASNGAWGGLKLEKAFVQQAEATITGDFMNPPA